MAAEGSQAPSPPLPPLPPDPAPARPTLRVSQPPQVSSDVRSATPSTPPGQRRVDVMSSPVSGESPIVQQRQPIRDAVNSAASTVFEHSSVPSLHDPAVLANILNELSGKVTEQVLERLQAAGATPTPTTQPNFPPPPPSQQFNEPRSPTQFSADSGPTRFTPPSPERTRGLREERFSLSSSPEPPTSDAGSSFSRGSHDSYRSGENYRSSETPKASNEDTRRRSSYAKRRMSGAAGDREIPRSHASGSDPTARENSRRGSRESEVYDGVPSNGTRTVRVPSDAEETPLEKTWQPLFIDGNPTARLGMFLRGLALHLIDDCEPKCSIVVSPAKMLQFLRDTHVEGDQYPWDVIFGGNLSSTSISEMYRKLQCQHHLTQDRHDRPPTVPSLTPSGFDWFMTCLIQAHPEIGFERMKNAVMHMPISNADDKSERFPKQLSRRLFPQVQNIQAQQRLIASLHHEPEIIVRISGLAAMPPPPPSGPPPGPPPGSFQERERKPYSQPSSTSNAVDDDDLAPPSIQIERERKPYSAREGAGKTYSQEDSRPPPTSNRAEAPPISTRNSRTNSNTPIQPAYTNNGPSDPVPIPQRGTQRGSAGQAGMPPQQSNGGHSRSRRASPPMRNPYARSEPDFVDAMASSQAPYNSTREPRRDPYQKDIDDDAAKRYRSRSRVERNSNPHDEDPRGYPVGGRGVPIANGYEYGSGPGGPPIGQPNNGTPGGSYPARRPPMSGIPGGDERRRSMYNTSNPSYGGGDGGTDGYGSFANNGYPGAPPPQQSYGSSSQH